MKNLVKKNQLMISALAIMIAIAGYLQLAGPDLESELAGEGIYTSDAGQVSSDEIIAQNTEVDGLLDLSDEDLLAGLIDIESLDSDVDIIVDDYLDADMAVSGTTVESDAPFVVTDGTLASVDGTAQTADATPDEGEIPGEAVFTSSNGVAILSEAKLLKEQTRAKNKETLLEIINSAGLTDAQKQDAVDTMVEMTAIAEKEAAAEILLEAKGFQDVVVSVNGDMVDVVVNAAVLDDAMRAQIEDIVTRKTEVPAENIIISTVVQ